MLTTTRRDQRTRRHTLFTLEALDDRLVLSAAAAGAAAEAVGAKAAAVEARHEAKLARVEARHEAKLARVEARHEAKLARVEARDSVNAVVAIPVTTVASAAAHAGPTVAAAPAAGGTATASAAPAASSSPTIVPTPIVVGGNPTAPLGTGSGSSSSSSTAASSGQTGTLPANVAPALQVLYNEYEGAGGGTFTPTQPTDKLLNISGDSVEVSLKIGSSADFSSALAQLQSDGMKVDSSSSTYDLIDGMLPISELPAAAQIAASVNPISPPMTD